MKHVITIAAILLAGAACRTASNEGQVSSMALSKVEMGEFKLGCTAQDSGLRILDMQAVHPSSEPLEFELDFGLSKTVVPLIETSEGLVLNALQTVPNFVGNEVVFTLQSRGNDSVSQPMTVDLENLCGVDKTLDAANIEAYASETAYLKEFTDNADRKKCGFRLGKDGICLAGFNVYLDLSSDGVIFPKHYVSFKEDMERR